MTDLAKRLSEARDRFDGLSDDSIERLMVRAKHRGVKRKRVRVAVSTAALVLAVVTGALVMRPRDTAVHLADGSTVTLLDRDSELHVSRVSVEVLEVTLERGRGRFAVVENHKRVFRVHAGNVTVEVLGTEFTVELRTGDVTVEVQRGTVRVASADGERLLRKGEMAVFADKPLPPPVVPANPPDVGPAPTDTPAESAPIEKAHDAPAPAARRARWQAAAARGNYDAAFGELKAGGAEAVRDVPEELMLAADVARWSHHPQAAVPYLQRVMSEHGKDPRSQLAAFTLGRVYLEELGRPREAAHAFARARALGKTGPLAEDALAREVEAWSRAGDKAKAMSAAEDYLRRYPEGSHASSVRRFGGLE